MTTLKLALDWTPNINHIGFLIAKELGFYSDKGIDVQIVSPRDDNYQLTPGKKLELDRADLAIAPFETVISLNNKENKVNARAVYAILQEDLSCIVALQSSDIAAPKDLDGKVYSSYNARYEDAIVQQMVLNDGGTGSVVFSYPDKLEIWNSLLNGTADATWIFDNWEGVDVKLKDVAINKFRMADYGIPYGYSPVVLAKKERIEQDHESFSNFVKATKKGFLLAKAQPEQAIEILRKYLVPYDLQHIDLRESLARTVGYFGDEQSCGFMKPERVTAFLNWLVESKLEHTIILEQELFTNDLLQ